VIPVLVCLHGSDALSLCFNGASIADALLHRRLSALATARLAARLSSRVLEFCESSESVNLNLNLNLARVVLDDLDGVRPRRPHLPHKQLWRWCFCWRLIILCISSWSLTRQRSTWRRCVRIHHRLVRGVFLSSAPHLFQNWLSVQIDRSVVALRTNQLD
jgi:hypothetical protein